MKRRKIDGSDLQARAQKTVFLPPSLPLGRPSVTTAVASGTRHICPKCQTIFNSRQAYVAHYHKKSSFNVSNSAPLHDHLLQNLPNLYDPAASNSTRRYRWPNSKSLASDQSVVLFRPRREVDAQTGHRLLPKALVDFLQHEHNTKAGICQGNDIARLQEGHGVQVSPTCELGDLARSIYPLSGTWGMQRMVQSFLSPRMRVAGGCNATECLSDGVEGGG